VLVVTVPAPPEKQVVVCPHITRCPLEKQSADGKAHLYKTATMAY